MSQEFEMIMARGPLATTWNLFQVDVGLDHLLTFNEFKDMIKSMELDSMVFI